MNAARLPRWVLVLATLALVVTWCAQASHAQLSIVWRTSVVSWDSPATQFHDQLATQGAVYVDAARQLREHVGAALLACGRAVPADPPRGHAVAVTSRLTRSPPAA
jgi:hypothetical protein